MRSALGELQRRLDVFPVVFIGFDPGNDFRQIRIHFFPVDEDTESETVEQVNDVAPPAPHIIRVDLDLAEHGPEQGIVIVSHSSSSALNLTYLIGNRKALFLNRISV